MIRWLGPTAAIIGLALGMIIPRPASGNLTGAQLAVALTPPTLASGSSAELNCGWHTACGSPPTAGTALDWEDGGTGFGNPWYFRGFFYVSDSVRTAYRMYPLVNNQDPNTCDIMTVWITEIHSGALMAIPTYMHVNITSSANFSWQGGPWTVYNSRQIGTTIDDTGSSCGFAGSHVHEDHTSYRTNVVTITRNTDLYPTASQCHTAPCSSLGYGPYTNNSINNWIRRFAWAEGVVPH